LFASCTLAQLYVGNAWQGTWSDSKRGGGGSTYICVDPLTQTAHGTYSGIGLFSGYLWGNTLTGFWYEAGYDRPFGPFQLTISGSSFTGSWSYYESDGVVSNSTFSWSGSRSSNVKPEKSECLSPSRGGSAAVGTFESGNYLCHDPNVEFAHTGQQSVWGSFARFGNVGGYTPDNGITFLLSDFYYPDDDELDIGEYRPEGNPTTFGPCTDCVDDDGDTGVHLERIPTKRIVVGRFIDDREFCGFFWEGLYNYRVADGAICLQRTNTAKPDRVTCGGDIVYVNAQIDQIDTGFTSWILSQVQSAFDNLVLPPVVIVPNQFTQGTGAGNPTSTTYNPTTDSSNTSNGGNVDTGSDVSGGVSGADSGNGGNSGNDGGNSGSASSLIASTFVMFIALLAVF